MSGMVPAAVEVVRIAEVADHPEGNNQTLRCVDLFSISV
jgi:hypothetical protein